MAREKPQTVQYHVADPKAALEFCKKHELPCQLSDDGRGALSVWRQGGGGDMVDLRDGHWLLLEPDHTLHSMGAEQYAQTYPAEPEPEKEPRARGARPETRPEGERR